MQKIAKKIVDWSVETQRVETQRVETQRVETPSVADTQVKLAEPVVGRAVEPATEVTERPERLEGATYKVKTPLSEHAMYVTINDIVVNCDGRREARPFEVFINTKHLEHYQWVVALTRVLSALFRKGGDVAFLVDELKAVFDPVGGYWKEGRFMPSLIAEIGYVLEQHFTGIGIMDRREPDPEQKKLIAEKRAAYEDENRQQDAFAKGGFPAGAQLCSKCHAAAVVVLDGCKTCLNCADSKCG
ncbi:Ribonucleotide reductase, alpha subunit [mine drainage metagenome]|uniref:ribonucleoside-diphosphate reductase n=1 Tax=mine drainage metagenome TaxID=410659 RepID=T1BW01_9ZZZZ